MRAGVGLLAAALVAAVCLVSAIPAGASTMTYLGFRALVAQPDVVWEEWDAAIYGALEERGFEVTYGGALDDAETLSGYDLVALNIRRHLTAAEEAVLTRYVSEGGAVYGSWGGPMAASSFLQEVARARDPRSVYIAQVALLESPLARGIPDRDLSLPQHVGHQTQPTNGWEMVAMAVLPGGIPVARDEAGDVLGVLSQHSKGRAAVLGFGPEQEKYFARPEVGPVMLDNLLAWLLADRVASGERRWPNRVQVALPARAQVLSVEVNGRRLSGLDVKRVGSLRRVEVPVDRVGAGEEAEIRIHYRPLAVARDVETMVHLPWGTLRAAADSPARLAEYIQSLHATTVQPLLRGSNGQAWYRGMPEDKPDDELVAQYHGDFLGDLIRECHQRGIKVIGGIYFDNDQPLRQHPEAVQRDAHGAAKQDEYGVPLACFNNPECQDYNLATVEHLLSHYQLDGVILDDNYELDWYANTCFCEYCEDGFRRYCAAHGLPYQDPLHSGSYSTPGPRHAYRRERTQALATRARQIGQAHGKPVGGWVSLTADATHLAGSFDFLGGMAYTSPPRSLRAVLPRMGETDLLCLLWAPHADPARLEQEVREAIHAGAAAVGFWVRDEGGGYELDTPRTEAIRRAFAGVGGEWLRFYRENILTGDGRFAVVDGAVGRDELRLRIRNMGRKVERRVLGQLVVNVPRLDSD